MENLVLVSGQVAVLFALTGVGVLCRRTGLIDAKAVGGFVNLLLYVVTPCLIIDVFSRPFDPSRLKSLGLAFGISAAIHLAGIAAASLAFRRKPDAQRPVLALATAFSNAGFMGIPLEQAILGDDGVFYGVAYVSVFNLFVWSWGYSAMSRGGVRESAWRRWRTVLVNPGTAGLALGLPLFLLSARLPAVLASSVSHMASLNTPLAMVVIGWHLAGAKLGRVAKSFDAWLVAAIRLAAMPLLAILAMKCIGGGRLDRTMAIAVATAASAPVAAMVSMFSAKFGKDVDLSVGLVCGTTLASVATMPPVVALAMSVF